MASYLADQKKRFVDLSTTSVLQFNNSCMVSFNHCKLLKNKQKNIMKL